MADVEEYYLPDRHPLLENSLIQIDAKDVKRWFIPRPDFEKVVQERDELRKALALINVALRIRDPRVSVDAAKILDDLGHSFGEAKATASIILDVRSRAE